MSGLRCGWEGSTTIGDKRLRRAPGFGLLAKLRRINWLYVLLICLLGGVGYGALYSAAGGAARPYALPQTVRFGFGLAMTLCLALVSPRVLIRLAWPLHAGSLLLLAAVLHMGHVGKGAERWIVVAGMQMQPSELAKITLVMALAAWFHRLRWDRIGNPLFLLPPALMVLATVVLVLREPNLGTAAIIGVLGASLFVAAGMRLWQMVLLVAPLPLLGRLVYAHLHDYQKARIITFLHPQSDKLGAGYNIIQSKIALGSGGVWGQGYLHGTQGQFDFLPEKQTDFIFTTLAEEFGLVGGISVMTLLLLLVLGGMLMALRARNQFSRLLALGISMNFFLYCAVNLSMVMGAIPVGGVPLPLISYGSSAMLTVMFGFGLLLSVYVHRDLHFDQQERDKD
jgi:rod shape determining protein RodA